ncbi:MAG: hypothetical protein EON54_14090 [Alcaligenaceae bacterium]|nr:MAG: hypothetical protein EON54_14090 [Alcaligenaceae bacterium]
MSGLDHLKPMLVPYQGLGALASKVSPSALVAALQQANAAMRLKDDAKLLALSKPMADLGFSRAQMPNGGYNLIDKDGFHYAPFGGLKIVKTTDDNVARDRCVLPSSWTLLRTCPRT